MSFFQINYDKEYLTGRIFIGSFSHLVLIYDMRVIMAWSKHDLDSEEFTKIFELCYM